MLSAAEVKRLGRQAGFQIVRIASAEPFPELVPAMRDRLEKKLITEDALRGYEIFRDPAHYADPRADLPEARSIISLGLAYRLRGERDRTEPGRPCGTLPRNEWRDFYGDLARRRRAFVEELRRQGVRCTEPTKLTAKNAAHRAGVAAFVKSGTVHGEIHGPWLLVSSVVTDLLLEQDEPFELQCGGCRQCRDACPTKAIVSPYVVDVGRCLVHVLASEEWIPRELRPMVGNRINSCDMCLEACNRGLNPLIVEDSFTDPRKEWTNSPELLPLLDITEEEFQRSFADLEWHRTSSQLLKRNVLVALGNLGDPVALPALVRMLSDPDPMLRGHAAWALGRMGGDEVMNALEERLEKEEDDRAREEIELALRALDHGQ